MHRRTCVHGLQAVKMFAAVVCPKCGRNRVTDLDNRTTTCPYCNASSETKSLIILFRGESANDVRDALVRKAGIVEEEKVRGPDPDPMSTLEYNYGRAKGLDKYTVLAEGLTKINGTFTLSDVRSFEPSKADKIIDDMMNMLIIIEERPGKYRVP